GWPRSACAACPSSGPATSAPSSMPTRWPSCGRWSAAMAEDRPRRAAQDWEVRVLRDTELAAYKQLRDGMLARHPEAFTSDAETEMRREPESYRSRLGGGANGL